MDDLFILTPYFLDEPLPALEALSRLDWQLNVGGLPNTKEQVGISALHELLAARVAEILQSGDRPVSIAGDCCSAIGIAAGMQRAGIDHTLLWFDAHGDFNTWETTPSGFLGGMPLAMIVGRGEQTMPASVGLHPLPEERVILTDARDLDPGEKRGLDRSKVARLPSVTDLLTFSLPDAPILVHFDTDVLDPAYAPAMSYPAPDGPSPDELQEVFRLLASTGKVRAVSMSTWNPKLDGSGGTKNLCMQLLQTLLGS
jgi:arginase